MAKNTPSLFRYSAVMAFALLVWQDGIGQPLGAPANFFDANSVKTDRDALGDALKLSNITFEWTQLIASDVTDSLSSGLTENFLTENLSTTGKLVLVGEPFAFRAGLVYRGAYGSTPYFNVDYDLESKMRSYREKLNKQLEKEKSQMFEDYLGTAFNLKDSITALALVQRKVDSLQHLVSRCKDKVAANPTDSMRDQRLADSAAAIQTKIEGWSRKYQSLRQSIELGQAVSRVLEPRLKEIEEKRKLLSKASTPAMIKGYLRSKHDGTETTVLPASLLDNVKKLNVGSFALAADRRISGTATLKGIQTSMLIQEWHLTAAAGSRDQQQLSAFFPALNTAAWPKDKVFFLKGGVEQDKSRYVLPSLLIVTTPNDQGFGFTSHLVNAEYGYVFFKQLQVRGVFSNNVLSGKAHEAETGEPVSFDWRTCSLTNIEVLGPVKALKSIFSATYAGAGFYYYNPLQRDAQGDSRTFSVKSNTTLFHNKTNLSVMFNAHRFNISTASSSRMNNLFVNASHSFSDGLRVIASVNSSNFKGISDTLATVANLFSTLQVDWEIIGGGKWIVTGELTNSKNGAPFYTFREADTLGYTAARVRNTVGMSKRWKLIAGGGCSAQQSRPYYTAEGGLEFVSKSINVSSLAQYKTLRNSPIFNEQLNVTVNVFKKLSLTTSLQLQWLNMVSFPQYRFITQLRYSL